MGRREPGGGRSRARRPRLSAYDVSSLAAGCGSLTHTEIRCVPPLLRQLALILSTAHALACSNIEKPDFGGSGTSIHDYTDTGGGLLSSGHADRDVAVSRPSGPPGGPCVLTGSPIQAGEVAAWFVEADADDDCTSMAAECAPGSGR